jgi:hypothetical protein
MLQDNLVAVRHYEAIVLEEQSSICHDFYITECILSPNQIHEFYPLNRDFTVAVTFINGSISQILLLVTEGKLKGSSFSLYCPKR